MSERRQLPGVWGWARPQGPSLPGAEPLPEAWLPALPTLRSAQGLTPPEPSARAPTPGPRPERPLEAPAPSRSPWAWLTGYSFPGPPRHHPPDAWAQRHSRPRQMKGFSHHRRERLPWLQREGPGGLSRNKQQADCLSALTAKAGTFLSTGPSLLGAWGAGGGWGRKPAGAGPDPESKTELASAPPRGPAHWEQGVITLQGSRPPDRPPAPRPRSQPEGLPSREMSMSKDGTVQPPLVTHTAPHSRAPLGLSSSAGRWGQGRPRARGA